MLDLKSYREKELASYDLDVELFNEFNFSVYNVMPLRKAFLISTDKGEKILKKIDYTIEEFKFVLAAVNYIKNENEFNRIIDFNKTQSGEYYCIKNGDLYCVMDMIEGKECEFSNPVDLSISSFGLGQLHSASEGFRYSKIASKNICGKMIKGFKRKKEEVNFLKKMVNLYESLNEFDEIFIKNVDYYLEQIDKSIDIMNKSQYYKLCSEEDKIVLCHHDLAHHNIIIKDEEAYFIDFDYAIIDLKVHDLSNIISKAAKVFNYSIDNSKIIISNYCKSNTLSKNEMEVLFGMLSFPEDFYEIVKSYYTKRKDWSNEEFINKMKRKMANEENRVEFLKNFKEDLKI
ncbi:CotS family spore coat protein [Clostridium acetobutylicum]|uniref:Spore coat protein cotS related n=1 Tax=Clostridium acetobutylicum (strain ATCC 824 / DSM 792 / JCM 1419 / IAM 19013 / LMG 5710 / NBRC 13948 / NRRL B-527 / VKM B-1787 / 2291 / W) TaxID=272562 RepID=Q97F45_CLOAB|nr:MULTISPECIES: CotS family spore coat protein [Clostridium]AAK80850.1 Spore coat protein cotS related [Clostridium acetobutylicum ATCC 824]ADZ21952.1 Spore coat protein cotS relted protein [Clostridium acetobutylicum EA 2018]AEI34420.1 spore coat protein cotS [Clostridium acetobutylicum DSM 1731]AWV78738.1 CotS family spore coat protein [Clostridium acetobutylicum]KHD37212.1 spore coat protein [Clostridium acetobutylicum]